MKGDPDWEVIASCRNDGPRFNFHHPLRIPVTWHFHSKVFGSDALEIVYSAGIIIKSFDFAIKGGLCCCEDVRSIEQ